MCGADPYYSPVRLDHKTFPNRHSLFPIGVPGAARSVRMTSQSSSSARICSAPADSVASSRHGSLFVLFTSDDPASANHSFPGGHTAGVTPVPIPNTEVKPRRADDTARVTVWERRSPPGLDLKGLGPRIEAFLFLQLPDGGATCSSSPSLSSMCRTRLPRRTSIASDSASDGNSPIAWMTRNQIPATWA